MAKTKKSFMDDNPALQFITPTQTQVEDEKGQKEVEGQKGRLPIKQKAEKKVQFNLKMPEQIKDSLDKIANMKQMSTTNLIVSLLDEFIVSEDGQGLIRRYEDVFGGNRS